MATIKGVWTFKGLAPFTAPAETIVQAVNCKTADGVAHNLIEIKNGVDSYPVLLNLDGWTVAIYNGETEFRWLEEYPEYKVVYFGETEQTVSDEFYTCFVQIAEQSSMTLADKLAMIAENEQRVYDAGYEAGVASTSGGGLTLPTYETDITYVGSSPRIELTHNLNTQKFLLIGRVKEHDGTDFNTWRMSQVVVWSPYAFAQNAEYNLASGGTYNPYRSFIENDASTGSYLRVVSNGGATSTGVVTQEVGRKKSQLLNYCTDNAFSIALNNYMLSGATWHFTVVDVSSIM